MLEYLYILIWVSGIVWNGFGYIHDESWKPNQESYFPGLKHWKATDMFWIKKILLNNIFPLPRLPLPYFDF